MAARSRNPAIGNPSGPAVAASSRVGIRDDVDRRALEAHAQDGIRLRHDVGAGKREQEPAPRAIEVQLGRDAEQTEIA
jgi:hypothetical protein